MGNFFASGHQSIAADFEYVIICDPLISFNFSIKRAQFFSVFSADRAPVIAIEPDTEIQ